MRSLLCILVLAASSAGAYAAVTLDKIVATVDRHAIMRSDVEREARFTHMVENRPGDVTHDEETAALDRLVDRDLIHDQIVVFGMTPVSEADIGQRLVELRKQIPGAETDAGWKELLRNHGLEESGIKTRVADEIQVLRFIEMRFGAEVRVGPHSIQNYYDQTFVPEMKKQNLTPPPLADVQTNIEAILREQRVDALISDWIKALRSQSRIQAFDPSLPLTGLDKRTPDVSDLKFLPLHVSAENEAAKQ